MSLWPFTTLHDDPVVRAYVSDTARRPRARTPLADVRFVVIDAETTGFKVPQDRMLSLAALPLQGGRAAVRDMRSWLIRQPAPAVTDAVAVHGILPCETARGTDERQVLYELLPLLRGAVLVGHHVRFDAEMIHAALQRQFGAGLRNPLLDTAHLAMGTLEAFRKTGYANQRPPSLEEVCALCQIEAIERHTAVGDTFTTAEVFLLLLARLRHMVRNRPLRLGDLLPVRF
ncbi:MAG: 3'-5' exonuclease [Opitutaceae bacterium]|nr:3'-5' exonuclease [Opitutaceae bacterium]